MKPKAILTALAATALLVGCEKKPSVEQAQEQAKSAVESAKDAAQSASEAASEAAKSAANAFSAENFVKETPQAQALKKAVDEYEKEATPPNQAAVDQAIVDLNGKIAELQEKAAQATGAEKEEATAQVKSLTEFRNEETARFAKAQTAPTPSETAEPQSSLQKLEDGAKNAGEAIKEKAGNAGEAIKETAHSAGEKLKDAKESAGNVLKRAGEALENED